MTKISVLANLLLLFALSAAFTMVGCKDKAAEDEASKAAAEEAEKQSPINAFIEIAKQFAKVAEDHRGDCEKQGEALNQFLDENEEAIKTLALELKDDDSMGTDEETRFTEALDAFKAATEECPRSGVMLLGLLGPLMDE